VKSNYVDQYEDLEKRHWWWLARQKIITSILKRLSKEYDRRPMLLDIGCGAGIQLGLIQNFDSVGIEPSPVLAERARINTGAKILNTPLPLEPGSLPMFDCVLMHDVLEHIDNDREALQSVLQFVSPSGFIIVNVPAHPWLWSIHDVVNEHKRRYTRRDLIRLLESADLQIEKVQYWGSFLVPAAFLQRRRHGDPNNYRVSIPSPAVCQAMSRLLTVDFMVNSYLPSWTGLSLLSIARKK
jgi:SAM-dependent methyltransferase